MGEKGEGSGGEGGGKWGERGRELGMGYPPVHPLILGFVNFCVDNVGGRRYFCGSYYGLLKSKDSELE